MVIIDIKKRNRQYGLITWTASQQKSIESLFDKADYITFHFNGQQYKRKISYKYKRFAFGIKRMESLKNYNRLKLKKSGNQISILPLK